MDLRQIKTEIENLENPKNYIKKIKNSWIKPIRSNTNKHLSFLKNLNEKDKKKINNLIYEFNEHAKIIIFGENIKKVLQIYIIFAKDLKLSIFQKNNVKIRYITNQLKNDEFLNLNDTKKNIKNFDKNIKKLTTIYTKTNKYVSNLLSLDEQVNLLSNSHKHHIKDLHKLSKNQRILFQKFKKEFNKYLKKKEFEV